MNASGDFFGLDRPCDNLLENDVIPDVADMTVKAVAVLFSLLLSLGLGSRTLK